MGLKMKYYIEHRQKCRCFFRIWGSDAPFLCPF
nr:MAG TPA: hypothetical protein [Caudoviricetes sp.]